MCSSSYFRLRCLQIPFWYHKFLDKFFQKVCKFCFCFKLFCSAWVQAKHQPTTLNSNLLTKRVLIRFIKGKKDMENTRPTRPRAAEISWDLLTKRGVQWVPCPPPAGGPLPGVTIGDSLSVPTEIKNKELQDLVFSVKLQFRKPPVQKL